MVRPLNVNEPEWTLRASAAPGSIFRGTTNFDVGLVRAMSSPGIELYAFWFIAPEPCLV